MVSKDNDPTELLEYSRIPDRTAGLAQWPMPSPPSTGITAPET
jgi:hypothetical protein